MALGESTNKAWFVDDNGTVIDWSTAVVGGVATKDIFQITVVGVRPIKRMWARAEMAVPAARITLAKAVTASGPAPREDANHQVTLTPEQVAAAFAEPATPARPEARLEQLLAGAYVELDTLLEIGNAVLLGLARTPESLVAGAVNRDANGAVTTAAVRWPDGTPGTLTTLVASTAFPGAVDSYKITYGSPVRKTFTQPTITRDASGAATVVPAITVA